MAVYVDTLINYGFGKGCFKGKKSCHLLADSPEELREFAVKIGLSLSWIQEPPKCSFLHFDLVESRRITAVKAGAIELDRRELLSKINELRGSVAYERYNGIRKES